ncbi:50S ribosomal protein L7/L12 [Leptospira interrogans]|uniref:50S ribosomal protein L7/L12 n=1 Tax=Leptospira interrogans TaxID=173 RepID=UPI0007738BD8|nr:50S ribosomal protein L7/L12 [Leptospira interrogans]
MSTEALLEQIGKLTLVEAADLVKKMEDKFGISAAAPVAVAAVGAAPAGAAEEASTFNVILKGFDSAKKIEVIKLVREITGLGLADAKGLVEAGGKAVKEGVAKAEADDLKKKFEGAGAQIELKAS